MGRWCFTVPSAGKLQQVSRFGGEIQAHVAAQETVGAEVAQLQVGTGHGRVQLALAVAGRPDTQQPESVDARAHRSPDGSGSRLRGLS